jgi:hypothetical protein
VPKGKEARIAKALPRRSGTRGQPQSIRDQTQPWKFECGGGCLTSTGASTISAFAQMLLKSRRARRHPGSGRKTVEYMTCRSPRPEVGRHELHNFRWSTSTVTASARRRRAPRGPGVAGIMGTPGDYRWSARRARSSGRPEGELASSKWRRRRAHPRALPQVIATLVQQAIVD